MVLFNSSDFHSFFSSFEELYFVNKSLISLQKAQKLFTPFKNENKNS